MGRLRYFYELELIIVFWVIGCGVEGGGGVKEDFRFLVGVI